MREKSAAIITIKDADKMTLPGRTLIADWLRKQAEALENQGDQYAPLFRARYLYTDRSNNG